MCAVRRVCVGGGGREARQTVPPLPGRLQGARAALALRGLGVGVGEEASIRGTERWHQKNSTLCVTPCFVASSFCVLRLCVESLCHVSFTRKLRASPTLAKVGGWVWGVGGGVVMRTQWGGGCWRAATFFQPFFCSQAQQLMRS